MNGAEGKMLTSGERCEPGQSDQQTTLRSGYTRSEDAEVAADELLAQLGGTGVAAVLLFCSSQYDLARLASALTERFGDVPVIGCTSSGELTPVGYHSGSITGVAFPACDFAVAIRLVEDLETLEPSALERIVHSLREEAGAGAQALGEEAKQLALLLINGLCDREEVLTLAVRDALGDIPLIGGSAGDDLAFAETYVLHDGAFREQAALLILLSTRRPFRIFRHHHLKPTSTRMVVTAADPIRRLVTEINAVPAAGEYMRLAGIEGQELSAMTFALHPVMVRGGGEYHVRSIKKVHEDGSLTFHCAIDEGIVLTLAESADILVELRQLFSELERELGPPEFVLAFECVHRALEIENRQLKQVASELLVRNRVVGFSTYGEQFNGLHVNQTFTGVGFG